MQNKTTRFIASLTLIAFILSAMVYGFANEQIAIHWNSEGMVDATCSKQFLLLCPFTILLSDMILRIARRIDPWKDNYRKFSSGFNVIRTATALLLFACSIITALEAYQPGSVKISLFVPLIFGIMICIFGNIMPNIRPNFSIGIKNPWTLSDQTVWQTTHRITGWIWFCGGMLLCLCAFLKHGSVLFVIILSILVIWPNLYSYLLYRKTHIRKEHSHD